VSERKKSANRKRDRVGKGKEVLLESRGSQWEKVEDLGGKGRSSKSSSGELR